MHGTVLHHATGKKNHNPQLRHLEMSGQMVNPGAARWPGSKKYEGCVLFSSRSFAVSVKLQFTVVERLFEESLAKQKGQRRLPWSGKKVAQYN